VESRKRRNIGIWSGWNILRHIHNLWSTRDAAFARLDHDLFSWCIIKSSPKLIVKEIHEAPIRLRWREIGTSVSSRDRMSLRASLEDSSVLARAKSIVDSNEGGPFSWFLNLLEDLGSRRLIPYTSVCTCIEFPIANNLSNSCLVLAFCPKVRNARSWSVE